MDVLLADGHALWLFLPGPGWAGNRFRRASLDRLVRRRASLGDVRAGHYPNGQTASPEVGRTAKEYRYLGPCAPRGRQATPNERITGCRSTPRSARVRLRPGPGPLRQLAYRRCGRSGLKLPPISLGLWQNFGDDRPLGISRAILRRAFDLGITHFDLANNYGPPYGSAEINFGRILAEDFGLCATSWSSRPRPATTCGPVRTATGGRASTCSPAWTRACGGCAWTTSTSSTRTGPIPRRRWRRRWARSTPRSARARPCTWGSPPTARAAPRRRSRSCVSSAPRCSSTSPPTRCSTAGSSPSCSTCSTARASAASPSRRWPRGC